MLKKIIQKIKYYLNKFLVFLRENKLIIILLLIYPIILHYILQIIFGVVFTLNPKAVGLTIHKFTIGQSTFKEFLIELIKNFVPVHMFLEYLLVIALILIFFGIVGKIKTSILMTTIITVFFASINHFITKIRGIPFALSDIFALKTAMNVAKGYSLDFSIKYFFAVILIFSYVGIIYFVGRNEKRIKNIGFKLLIILLGIMIIFSIKNTEFMKNYKIWNLSNEYSRRGQLVPLLKQFDDIIIKKPEGYSKEKAISILKKYNKENVETSSEPPNIIVILNESFSDLKDLYSLPMEENIPFFKSLKENTIKGDLYTGNLGGGTATVEWEFLTGNSMAFIPYGSTPYLQYIHGEKESIVKVFNNLQYDTTALHAYKKTGYNREKVYKYFDFKNTYFKEDFDSLNCITLDYPDDKSVYNNFFYKQKLEDNKNTFGFIVTMQNHLPYKYRFNETINYTGKEEIDEYLSLVNKSDEALKDLINLLEKEEKNTILLFFGDHQPGLVKNYEEFKEKNWNDNYKTKFLLWANYDIEEKENVEISTNYLSLLLSDIAKINKNEYMNFLEHIRNNIPIITSNGYKGKDGIIYEINDKESPYYELINEYKIVQYYEMFEK